MLIIQATKNEEEIKSYLSDLEISNGLHIQNLCLKITKIHSINIAIDGEPMPTTDPIGNTLDDVIALATVDENTINACCCVFTSSVALTGTPATATAAANLDVSSVVFPKYVGMNVHEATDDYSLSLSLASPTTIIPLDESYSMDAADSHEDDSSCMAKKTRTECTRGLISNEGASGIMYCIPNQLFYCFLSCVCVFCCVDLF